MNGSVVILMGVSGVGKTTVGRRLATLMGWEFHDGDDLHPPENIRKMAAGQALSDEDRIPWLERVHELILEHEHSGRNTVIACSALKDSYRRGLLEGTQSTRFIYLRGEPGLLENRLRRRGHFFEPRLLSSQFAALEEPQNVPIVDVGADTESVVTATLVALGIHQDSIPLNPRGC